jgi:hypothetical protein
MKPLTGIKIIITAKPANTDGPTIGNGTYGVSKTR